MAPPPRPPGPDPDDGDTAPSSTTGHPHDTVITLGTQLLRLVRMVHLVKAHTPGLLPSGVEWGAMGLLDHLVTDEGRRQRELVCATMLDPSTVSRHVAGLVQAGLVERRADPGDGRAVRLVATERGRELIARLIAHRVAALEPLIDDWDHDEVVRLTTLLTRLCDRMQVEHLDAHPTCPGHRQPPVSPGAPRVNPTQDHEESR